MAASAGRVAKFTNLSRLARLIQDSHDLKEVLHKLTESVCLNSDWDFSSIQAIDTDSGTSVPIVRYNPFKTDTSSLPVAWDAAGSPGSTVIETGRPMVIADAAAQDDYPGFREDARQRGYHTSVVMPLKFPDENGRALIFVVISFRKLDVAPEEMAYLQCLADLADVVVRRMLKLAEEAAAAAQSRQIVRKLTSALASSLDVEMAEGLFEVVGDLIPTDWFAIDLTTGALMTDARRLRPGVNDAIKAQLFALMRMIRLQSDQKTAESVPFDIAGISQPLRIRRMVIDGEMVGALFLLNPDLVGPQEWVSVEAAHLALSTVILRNYMGFRNRTVIERRALQHLCAGSPADRHELLTELRVLGIDMTQPRRLLIIQSSGGAWPGDMHSYVLRKAEAQFGPALSMMSQDRLTLLIADGDRIADERQREQFLKSVQSSWPHTIVAVISEPVSPITDYPEVWESAGRQLGVALAMGASGWVTAGKIGYFPRLMASLPQSACEAFLSQTVTPLFDSSQTKGDAVVETLRAFLATGRRLQETADQLGIHVSTLRYRLQRFSERYGLDLEDNDTCFELELAIRLHGLRSSYHSH